MSQSAPGLWPPGPTDSLASQVCLPGNKPTPGKLLAKDEPESNFHFQELGGNVTQRGSQVLEVGTVRHIV